MNIAPEIIDLFKTKPNKLKSLNSFDCGGVVNMERDDFPKAIALLEKHRSKCRNFDEWVEKLQGWYTSPILPSYETFWDWFVHIFLGGIPRKSKRYKDLQIELQGTFPEAS